MQKTIIGGSANASPGSSWLDLEAITSVELTSEDSNFPIESALAKTDGPGWRAAQPGRQIIRILFDDPRPLHRIRLEFYETEVARTQEFTLHWSQPGGPLREIVRQQWNFNPQGSTCEVEDYRVDLPRAAVLELALTPDLASSNAFASLAAWRVA
jgi:hypothetical protein